ncbi:S1 family peptidase [Paenibacillus faecalis]|uniref:S1 family peptidase n=1 Tax=Paenibacillus faecalis TaxID=2079532 RepID=UPI000D0EBB1B|nr:S1 family peptidase [Paenibacillus faecalis]
MLKKIMSTSLVVIMFFFLGINGIEARESDLLSNGISENELFNQRAVFGLPTNSLQKSESGEMRVSQKYGFYLTETEELALDERFKKQDEYIPKLKEEITSTPDLKEGYLGMYIDQTEGGVVYIGFKKDMQGLQTKQTRDSQVKELQNATNNELTLKIYEATYSEQELDEATNTISQNVQQLKEDGVPIEYVNLDFINQKIVIGIDGEVDQQYVSKISKLVSIDPAVIELKKISPNYSTYEEERYFTYPRIHAGLVIDINPNTTGNCSVGFSAIDSSSNPYIVTAEHCWPKQVGTGIYQGSNYIGVLSSKKHYGNEVDAVAVRVTSNDILSSKVYGEAQRFTGVQVAGDDVLGERVCKAGMWGNRCGTLQSKNHSAYWGHDNPYGKTWFTSLRVANYLSSGGDSGGTIWNDKTGTLKGVHKGSYENEEGTTLRVYSHVTHVQNRLGVTPVTWLPN